MTLLAALPIPVLLALPPLGPPMAVAVALTTLTAATPMQPTHDPALAQSTHPWAWPLAPPVVVHRFERPSTEYAAGHRGVDLAGRAGQAVLAVDAGTVTHVGVIAGRGTVTVLHSSGIRSTYEPLAPTVRPGAVVTRGSVLGTLTEGGHCGSAPCLHLGAVRGSEYLDPMDLLATRRVRLLPLTLGDVPADKTA